MDLPGSGWLMLGFSGPTFFIVFGWLFEAVARYRTLKYAFSIRIRAVLRLPHELVCSIQKVAAIITEENV